MGPHYPEWDLLTLLQHSEARGRAGDRVSRRRGGPYSWKRVLGRRRARPSFEVRRAAGDWEEVRLGRGPTGGGEAFRGRLSFLSFEDPRLLRGRPGSRLEVRKIPTVPIERMDSTFRYGAVSYKKCCRQCACPHDHIIAPPVTIMHVHRYDVLFRV